MNDEKILGKKLPEDYILEVREFTGEAIAEIVKELRSRSSDGKLSSILRPVNGIIRTSELAGTSKTIEGVKKVLIAKIKALKEEDL